MRPFSPVICIALCLFGFFIGLANAAEPLQSQRVMGIDGSPLGYEEDYRIPLQKTEEALTCYAELRWRGNSLKSEHIARLAETFYRKFGTFPEGNPKEDLIRCGGEIDSAFSRYGVQAMMGYTGGKMLTLHLRSLPLRADTMLAIKLYGAEWICPWDDNFDGHRRSLPNGFILRKPSSDDSLCQVRLSGDRLYFALMAYFPGNGFLTTWYFLSPESMKISDLAGFEVENFSPLERNRRRERMRNFFVPHEELRDFTKHSFPFDRMKPSASGGGCNVYYCKIEGLELAVKKGKREQQQITKEIEVSGAFKMAAEKKASELETDLADFQGFNGVVKVLGKGPDKILVQPRVTGTTLEKAITNPIPGSFYHPDGLPRDLSATWRLTLELVAEVMALHASGVIHEDLYARNVMLDQEGHIHLIDLDRSRSVGEGHWPTVGHADYPKRARFEFLEEKLKQLREQEKGLLSTSKPVPAELRRGIEDTLQQYGKEGIPPRRYDEARKVHYGFIPAELSDDIYMVGQLLVKLLFGRPGREVVGGTFICNQRKSFEERFKGSLFRQETVHLGYEKRVRYFHDMLNKLNGGLTRATGKGYAAPLIQKLSELLAWMMDQESSHRPTSQQVFTSLLEIWEESLEKLPPKHPAKPLRLSPRWEKWKGKIRNWSRTEDAATWEGQVEKWVDGQAGGAPSDRKFSEIEGHPPLFAMPSQR